MAKRFTRNIRSIKDIEKQPKNTNQQNDLLSDEKDVYVRNKDQYEQITGGVKEVNGETPDSDGSVEIDTGAMTVNNEKPDKNGNVTIDTGTNNMNDFIKQKQNEKSFMKFLKENSVITSNNTISLTGDRNINTVINLSEKDNVKLNFRKNGNDDFIKFTNLDYEVKSDLTEPSLVKEDFTDSMVSNSLNGSKGNFYTKTIGTTITFNFKGENISIRYYSDNRGGVWKATIDDEFIKNISTHAEAQNEENYQSGNDYKTLIKDNMEDKEHTLVLEFMGEDENNPTDTPRGWIKQSDNDDRYTFYYLTNAIDNKVVTNALYNSNKEFAFDISYNNTREWVPEHNNTGTLKLSNNGSQKLFIDGKAYSINEPLSETSFTEVKILQNLYGINSKNGDETCHILCITTITSQGVKFNTKLTWLKELTVNHGYVNMFTLNPQFFSSLTTSYANNYDLNIYDNSYVYLKENAPYSFVGLSDKYDDVYLTCDNINGYNSLRLGYDDRSGDKYGNGLIALQHRDENLQKIYPQPYRNHKTKKGEVYEFEGFYGYGKLPMIKDLLK